MKTWHRRRGEMTRGRQHRQGQLPVDTVLFSTSCNSGVGVGPARCHFMRHGGRVGKPIP